MYIQPNLIKLNVYTTVFSFTSTLNIAKPFYNFKFFKQLPYTQLNLAPNIRNKFKLKGKLLHFSLNSLKHHTHLYVGTDMNNWFGINDCGLKINSKHLTFLPVKSATVVTVYYFQFSENGL